MDNMLFLLCPTDSLQSKINTVSKCKNYFYTSLGNSFNFDDKIITEIKELIQKHTINEIYFVLSNDNKIVLDALEGQSFSEIKGLKRFYKEIEKDKMLLKILTNTENNNFSIISFYLNKKIKALKHKLEDNLVSQPVKIYGKIYNKEKKSFMNIFSNLNGLEKFRWN